MSVGNHQGLCVKSHPELEDTAPIWGLAALDARRKRAHQHLSGLAGRRENWIKQNAYYYGMLGHLLGFIIAPQKRVLSVRGNARQLADVKPSAGVLVEICEEIVTVARKEHPELTFRIAHPDTADFAEQFGNSEKFDYIIFNCVDDTADIEAALKNLRHLSTPETRLIVVSYNPLWAPVFTLAEKLGLKLPELEQNWLSKIDIINFLETCGYECLKSYPSVFLPKYVPLLSGFLNGFCARLPGLNRLSMLQVYTARLVPEAIDPEKLKVSVIIPCKDEQGNIASAVERMPKLGGRTEIIFCDDKSTDGTVEEIQRMQALHSGKDIRLVAGPGICKSQNVWAGFRAATGDVLMILDADLTTMPEELPSFLELLCSGRAEFVNGSRLVYAMPIGAMKGANMLGNKFFSLVFSYLLDQRVKDTLCGTKVLWRKDWQRLEPLLDSWGTQDRWGDYELLFGASKLNLRIRDLPVHYQERLYGSTKMTRVFKNGLIMLRMCFYGFLRLKLGY